MQRKRLLVAEPIAFVGVCWDNEQICMQTTTKILISGGGIAGCSLALLLREKGFQPVVIDNAPEFKRIGYLLALNAQIGQKAAEKMGLLDTLRQFEVPLTRSTLLDTYGKTITSFEVDYAIHNQRVGMMMNRADLHETLYGAIRDKVVFRFGESIASLVDTGKEVSVVFTSGRKETFDLVIGADGVHSHTRTLVFGEGFEVPLGQAYFAFTTPNHLGKPVAAPNEAIAVRAQGFTLAYHMLKNNEIGGYIFHDEATGELLSPKERKAFMIQAYAPASDTFRRIVETMPDDTPVFHDGFTQVVMPQWNKGRVCLLGDAASCPTPASGVGASLAMAGAYVLAKYIGEYDSHEKAFAEYDAYVRPTVKKAHKMAQSQAGLASGKSFISYGFTNAILRLLPVSLVSRIHSHEISMTLP